MFRQAVAPGFQVGGGDAQREVARAAGAVGGQVGFGQRGFRVEDQEHAAVAECHEHCLEAGCLSH